MPKVCTKCNHEHTSFGPICAHCRKGGQRLQSPSPEQLTNLPSADGTKVVQLFASIDLDGNESVTLDEWLQVFDRIDENGRGAISRREWSKKHGASDFFDSLSKRYKVNLTRDEWRNSFARVDSNGDGQISIDELLQVCRAKAGGAREHSSAALGLRDAFAEMSECEAKSFTIATKTIPRLPLQPSPVAESAAVEEGRDDGPADVRLPLELATDKQPQHPHAESEPPDPGKSITLGISSVQLGTPRTNRTRRDSIWDEWDADGIPLQDTNMAGVGGEEDMALRKQAAGGEPAWQGIGLEPGVWVFRIEAFQVVPWPREKHGMFHEGDSYIVLQVEFEINGETGKLTDKLQYDIHFWLGKKTSTDEKGTAAYKTVELDAWFDDQAVQHREVQGSESQDFLSYFENGVQYLPGGVESGFKVTQLDIFVSRLWQVRRTAKKAIVIEEEAVDIKSLNHRDAFILEKGRTIYAFFGDDCSAFVKHAANAKAESMETASNGEQTACTEIGDDFWEAFGGRQDITPADQVGEELPPDFGEGVLYNIQVSEDEERKMTITEVARGDLERHHLDTTGVMMVDTRTEIFLWLGNESSKLEKATAFRTASNYLKMNGRDVDKTAITVLKEGSDSKNKSWVQMFGLDTK